MMIPLICLLATVAVYATSKRFYRKFPRVMFTPVVLTPVIVILILVLSQVPYDTYHSGTHYLSDMIGPATVALAVPLYKNRDVFKKHAVPILISVLAGSTAAIATSAWIAKSLNLNLEIIDSMVPRSATTPIAVVVSEYIGGIPAITAVFVLFTGVLGMVLGPLVIRFFRFKNAVAHGVLLGTSAHAIGTTKAFELSSVSGSISTVAMILTAFFTLCTAPWIIQFIL
ncbi:MAG: LrgB family protein [Paenibacillaceae bacterium]|jgi:predicted murein hydrolase (TIGR00659 family)|nr:LrgB family protein [Paenibacillaceae bacterium]